MGYILYEGLVDIGKGVVVPRGVGGLGGHRGRREEDGKGRGSREYEKAVDKKGQLK